MTSELNTSTDVRAFIPKDYCPEWASNKFNREGRNFDFTLAKNYIDTLISKESFSKNGKDTLLNDIYEDAKYVNSILEPLKDLGLLYSLDLTGGAVRDFVLDLHKNIKDLDFMVKIVDYPRSAILTLTDTIPELASCEVDLTSACYLDQNDKQTIDTILLDYCLSKSLENTKTLKSEKLTYTIFKRYGSENETFVADTNRRDRLTAVIKVEETHTNYPVDILVTDFAKPEFINAFDFDICKASFSFVCPYYNVEFPSSPIELVSRFVAPPEFFADYHNKKFTFCPDELAEWQIERSITNHLPRLVAKFPDFKLNIVGDAIVQQKQTETILLSKELRDALSKKNQITSEPVKKKSSKI